MLQSVRIFASSILLLAISAALAAADRPNVVLVLIDDMGWNDVSCSGSTFYKTPHIDRLAKEGMRFTHAYSACTVCSPTRAAVLTGQYPARLHITDWIPGHNRPWAKLRPPEWTQYLPHDVPNLGRTLKEAGYATASVGKWHLGEEDHWPTTQGFDVNVAGTGKGSPPTYFSPYNISTLPDGPKGEFLSDRLAVEACKFIEQNKDQPFFVYMPHYGVHTPLMSKPEVKAKYEAVANPAAPQHNATYAGLVESVDDALGAVVAKLDALNLSKNTIIIFTSDNGGLLGSTSNVPARVGKGSAYEGGVRVPLIVKWPGVVEAGSTCDTPAISVDFYPTLLEATGITPKPDQKIDGESLMPLLKQTGRLKRDTVYWHYPHYHPGGATPYSAIRSGDYRLVEFYEDGRVELFNLRDDISETTDLATAMPEKTQELRSKLNQWREEIGAQPPLPNPNYDPARESDTPKAVKQRKVNKT
jgi:arylsulfatase A-like enzyme